MEGTQGELFNPGEHEHVWTLHEGPHETHSAITLPTGTRWCWTCGQWATLYRNGAWLNWRQSRDAGFTWRDKAKHNG